METEFVYYLLVFLIGIATGFINIVAAAGSLLSLPLLIFIGLPANEANATNRVGIFFQNLVGLIFFKKKGLLDTRGGLLFSIPCMLGSILGAYIAVDLDEALFKKTIGIIMLIMMAAIIFKPEKWLKGRIEKKTGFLNVKEFIAFFLVGIYGGFIQVGVGVFMLIPLVMISGYNLLHANSLKLFITFTFTIVALGIFLYYGLVNYKVGAVLSVGSMIGAWIGSKSVIKGGAGLIRWALIIAIFISAVKLLGVFEMGYSLFTML